MNDKTSCLDTEELVRAYKNNVSAYRLAKDHGVSIWSIITRLRGAGVEIRKDGTPTALRLEGKALSLFESLTTGILLGDGSINPTKKFLRLQQTKIRKGWIDQISSLFDSIGVKNRVIPIEAKESRHRDGRIVHTRESYLLYTTVCDEFRELRRTWYPEGEGKKRVPRTVRLDPVSLTHWLCGDGSGLKGGVFVFYTNGFVEEDVDFLVERLRADLGITAYKAEHCRPGQFIIRVGRREDGRKLADTVRPHMPDCCSYKLQHI